MINFDDTIFVVLIIFLIANIFALSILFFCSCIKYIYFLYDPIYARIMIYICIFFKSHPSSMFISRGNQYSDMNFPSDGGRTIYFSLEQDHAIYRRFPFPPFSASLL